MTFFGNIQDLYLPTGNNPFGFVAQNTTSNTTNPVTVPVVQNQQPATEQKLTEAGNVPLGTTNSVDMTKGTTVEITSSKKTQEIQQKQQAENTKREEQIKIDEKNRSTMADRRDINAVMKRSVKNKDWDKLSFEDKQKEIIKFLENTPEKDFKYVGGRIGWLKTFMTDNRNMDSDETKLVVGAFKYLNVDDKEIAKLQAKSIRLTADKKAVNKYTAQTQVVTDMTKYGIDGQNASVDVTSTSEFDDIKLQGSTKVSQLDKTIQAPSVKKYMDGSLTSSLEVQKQIGFNLVDQYGQYAKEAELDIHKIISSSSISEIVERAASNIYKFDKDNQAGAVQITVDTKNEKAINAAASQYANYDKSAQAAVKEVLSTSQYESTKTALTTAEKEKTPVAESKKTAGGEPASKNTRTQTASEVRVAAVKQLIESKQPGTAILKDAVKNLSDLEKISMIRQYSNNVDLIYAIWTNNPSLAVISELKKIKVDKQFIDRFKNDNNWIGNIGFLNISAQSDIVKNSDTPDRIQRSLLSSQVKVIYDNRINEINGKNGVKENVVTA